MTTDFRPYPAYKASGIECLGDVPAHWDVLKLRHTTRSVTERNRPDLPLLSVVREKGVIVRDVEDKDENRNSIPDDLTNYKVVKRRQFAMNKMKAWQGSYGVSGFHGIVSPAYFVFDIAGVDADYFHTAIRSKAYVPHFTRASDGVRIGQWDLLIARMREIPFVVPPLPEQAAIVRFLDHAGRRIQRYIRTKQKLIALLEEQRKVATQGLIQSRSVTSKKIEVVADFVARPVRRVATDVYTPIGLYNRGRGIFKKEPRNGGELGDSDFFWVEEGDLVLSGQFAWEGAIALAGGAESGCVASHRYPIMQGRQNVLNSGFLLAFFQTDWGQLLLDHHSRGAAGRNRPLNARTLQKEKIPMPPLRHQMDIVEMLQRESRVRQQTEESRRLLNEYRTRLIADVVTGKLDVREAAAELPEDDVPGDEEESEAE